MSDKIIFENPPLAEVYCGISFRQLPNFYAPHTGLLWEKYKQNFPNLEEHPPLSPVKEQYGPVPTEIYLSDKPPLPRVWYIEEGGNGIIQVQSDRFIYNWRKITERDEYPRYQKVFSSFVSYLNEFMRFIQEGKIGNVDPTQYELCYVNNIVQGEGWNTYDDLHKVFPDFSWQDKTKKILANLEQLNWRNSFVIPDQQGRLHATIRNVVQEEDKKKILRFELMARGVSENKSNEAMIKWFELAHNWIINGFIELTSNELQKKVWKRT